MPSVLSLAVKTTKAFSQNSVIKKPKDAHTTTLACSFKPFLLSNRFIGALATFCFVCGDMKSQLLIVPTVCIHTSLYFAAWNWIRYLTVKADGKGTGHTRKGADAVLSWEEKEGERILNSLGQVQLFFHGESHVKRSFLHLSSFFPLH